MRHRGHERVFGAVGFLGSGTSDLRRELGTAHAFVQQPGSNERAHARLEFGGVEHLGDEIVGTCVQPVDHVALAARGGQN